MPTKAFANYNYDDAAQLFGGHAIAGTKTVPSTNPRRPQAAIAATDFYLGNHWQDSDGFIGQLPPLGVPFRPQILRDIEAGFVSENVVQEVVETHTGGILGREPVWSFLPADADKLDEARRSDKSSFENITGETLTPWWNERKGLRSFQQTTTTLLCEDRAVRRLLIPVGRLRDGKAQANDLASALKYIYFQTHTADVAGVFVDPLTQAEIGVFLYQEKDIKGDVTANCAELSFLDEHGDTVCRIVKDRGEPETYGPYPLGGHLLIYEIQRRALITEQVQSSQRALNLTHTMMMRNVNMAGARERHVTNAQPPLDVKRVAVDNETVSTTKVVAGTFKTGSGAVNFLAGFPIYGEDGQTIMGYTNPNVSIVDPASVETFVNTISTQKEAIYSQCHQRHVLIVDKADTSGRAREVARREFERSLKETKGVMDAAGRWQLESTLRLAAFICKQVSKYANLRADFNCLIDAGEPDPEKQKTVILLRQAGIISAETARNWVGVEDAAAELAKIKAESPEDPSQPTPADEPVLKDETVSTEADNAIN